MAIWMARLSGILLMCACGDPSAAIDPSEPVEEANSGSQTIVPPVQNEALFTGNWAARNPETGQVMVEWNLRVDEGRWKGSYVLTEHFCQTRDEQRLSACPFDGQRGEWKQIIASAAVLSAQAMDPFQTDAFFTLQMLAPDGETLSTVAFSADLGFVQLNADIETLAK
ncbi:MAG: hypothetical protein AAGJ32_05810 [Pseudomonadota bacterium]